MINVNSVMKIFKKLVVSGDLMSDKANKEYINNLKRGGVKIETVGLVL